MLGLCAKVLVVGGDCRAGLCEKRVEAAPMLGKSQFMNFCMNFACVFSCQLL